VIRRVMICAISALSMGLVPAGCSGLGSPGAPEAQQSRTGAGVGAGAASSVGSAAEATHEVSTPVPRQRTNGTSPAPAQAVRAFAMSYINWQADTVSAQLTALARTSVGQARSAMALQAAQTSSDYELKGGGLANQGTVEAVAPLAGGRGRYVVITRERTTATLTSAYDGLKAAWHVTVATVTELSPGGWVVSGWQPES
jgi:hypothetical protein